jgi:hypothetical protein
MKTIDCKASLEFISDLKKELKCVFDDDNASSSLYPEVFKFISYILNDVQQARGVIIPDNIQQIEQLNDIFNKVIVRIKAVIDIKGHEIIKSLIILHHIHEQYKTSNFFHADNVTDIIFYFIAGLMLV